MESLALPAGRPFAAAWNPSASNRIVSYPAARPSVHRRYPSLAMATITQTQQDNSAVENERSQVQFTHLEGNSWVWNVSGVPILVDPVIVGNLDFGVPWLYDAEKKVLKELKLEDLGKIEYLLITQSLDDHCHQKTLEPLSKMYPELPVVATPNAQPILSKLFRNVTYIGPGESTTITGKDNSVIKITASAGPVLGPPWQRPENGYFVETEEPKVTIYYEPHCISDRSTFNNKTADVLVTPIIKQTLPLYTLVSGQEDAVELAKVLQPRYVVTMANGDMNATGILSKLLKKVGTMENFKGLLKQALPEAQVLEPQPGVPLKITI